MTGEAWSVQGLPGIPKIYEGMGREGVRSTISSCKDKNYNKSSVTLKVIIMTKKEGNVFSFVTDSITFPFPKLFF